VSGGLILLLIMVSIVFGAVVGRQRLAGGRGDWTGGSRLGPFMLLSRMLLWGGLAHPTGAVQRAFDSLATATGLGFVQALFLFFLYIAVEPLVRKHTPELLIGWARVLQGRFRDPRVARDVLVGAVLGGAGLLSIGIVNAL